MKEEACSSPRRYEDTNQSYKITEDDLVELIPNILYFGCFEAPGAKLDKTDKVARKTHFISVHNKFHYEPFYEDFGPWNLSVLYRLCKQIEKSLETEEKRGRRIVLFCHEDGTGQYEKIRVNTAYVLGAFLIIYHGFTADDAYLKVSQNQPGFLGFRDAALGPPQYLLHIHDVLRGIEKALKIGWLDFSNFDYQEYEYYERVENGDFNWIIPGKILSFCGPHNESCEENGYPYHAPEVYFDYFRENGISTIVRLNAKNYDASKFTKAGFEHVDLFFVDGSTPSDEIVLKFIDLVDNAKGGVAVHCKAGLGRTGTLIACWMMKQFQLTAAECMGWLRVCRPGSVIGPQQTYLVEKQMMCWSLGAKNGIIHHPRRIESARKSSVRKLAHQVDEISLGEDRDREREKRPIPRPNILRRKAQVQQNGSSASSKPPSSAKIHDETALDEHGRSQGDRLLALKAKHQHQHPMDPPTRRYTSNNKPSAYELLPLPSQAYLNKNRAPATPPRTPTKSSSSSSKQESSGLRTSPNGAIAYRTRHRENGGGGNLPRTGNETYRFHNSLFYEPASAVFPSMASRRSEATRYASPTTPIKPMSPAFHPEDGSRIRSSRNRPENSRPPVTASGGGYGMPQFGLIRVPISSNPSPHLRSAVAPLTRMPLTPHNHQNLGQQPPHAKLFRGADKLTRGTISTSSIPVIQTRSSSRSPRK